MNIENNAPENGRAFILCETPADGDLGEEGFETTVANGTVTIRGGETRGCMYGVYDFLEEIIGYRFLTAYDTYLYEADFVDVPEGYSNKEIPVLHYRTVYDSQCGYTYKKSSFCTSGDFTARRKSNFVSTANEGKYGWAGLQNPHHGMSTYVTSVPDNSQPCLTEDAIFEECVDNISIYLNAAKQSNMIGKSVKIVNLGENDNPNFCNCKSCQKKKKEYGYTQSGLFVYFTSRVAEYFEEDFPTIRFGMFAYWGAIIPPQNIEAHKNVQLCYVMYGFDQKHPLNGRQCSDYTYQEGLNNKVHAQYIEEWRPIVHNQMHLWFYTVDFWRGLIPFMNVDDYCEDFSWIADKDFYGIFCQNGQSQLTFDELYVYLESLLAWNPYMSDEEFDSHMREFMELFYGDGWIELYNYLIEGCNQKDRLLCNETEIYDWVGENYDLIKDMFKYASDNCNTAKQEDYIELLSVHVHFQAVCGQYEEKYINGTDESKKELQDIMDFVHSELLKYKITWLGLESGKQISEVNFNLAEQDPRRING